MRNEKLVRLAENLARKAREFDLSDVNQRIQARIYAGLALDFLKLGNATTEDYKRVASILPDIDKEAEKVEVGQKLTIGKYRDGRWVAW
ncbi:MULTISPECIES: hypothetical protein [unclassified Archaeoglobus]|jgi:hypothetical protein|uniref:hypothetical protein n=1 Tax=unclassified Archaeoglobus TaxID=2643606 RepID=UPI0025C1462E|nr:MULTISPECIES: hypothetical protein [unclassified Archaeoglobus]